MVQAADAVQYYETDAMPAEKLKLLKVNIVEHLIDTYHKGVREGTAAKWVPKK